MKKVLLISVFPLCLFAFISRAGVLPLDDFIKHGDYLDLQISPDGRHLAARIRQDGAVNLFFMRLSDGKAVGGVRSGNDNEVHSVTWISDQRVVYEFAEKHHYLDDPIPTGELFAVDIDGKRNELLYGYRAGDARTGSRLSTKEDNFASHEILSILENDEKHILIIEYPWTAKGNTWYDFRNKPPIISKLNVFTGRKRRVEVIPYAGAYALADPKGSVNFIAWRDKSNKLQSAYRKNADEPWQELSAVLDLEDDFFPQSVNRDSTKAYLSGQVGEQGFWNLFEVDLTTGKSRQLFSDLNADLYSWVTDANTLEPVVGISYPVETEYHYAGTQGETEGIHKMLVRAFKGKDVSFTSRTRDGKLLLVRVGSDINPGEYYLFDSETKKADFLWANRSWIDPRQMQPVKNLVVPARDGVNLHGLLALPKADSNQKVPLVVLIHGGPHGVRDYWEYNNEVQLLANRGYAVLQVNYRGSGGFGKSFKEMGYLEWGGKMIDDIIDATRWVLANENIDGNRLCVFGASYGGYAALMSSVRAPDMFRCAIGYAGVYDLQLMYSKGDIPRLWGGEAYLEMAIGRDEEKLREFSPIHHVDKIKANVMLVHGGEDLRVPVVHAKRMRKALRDAGRDVEWLLYNRSGHGVWAIESRRELYQGVLDFLEKNIGDGSKLARVE